MKEKSAVNIDGRFAVIIPVYNHEQMIASVIGKAIKLGFPVYVIDDGSTDLTYDSIKNTRGINIIRHKINSGKGAAILTGFNEAMKYADWAITIDADGQHDPVNALNLINSIPERTRPIVVGKRDGMLSPDVPWTSRFGRKFSNFWVWLSGGPLLFDSQSGFRIYPLPEAARLNVKSRRFQFEVEVLVKARWKGIPVIECPVSVTYTPGGKRVSHFRPFMDFMRNTGTFTRLITLRIIVPWFLRSRFL